MKENKVLGLKTNTIMANKILARIKTMPGETTVISHHFINYLTDNEFREFCALDNTFKVTEKTAKEIRRRMKLLDIGFDIDFNNNTLKTKENGKESDRT
jgi:hypothetical protein